MTSTSFVSKNQIRIQFTKAMSEMYQLEVPLYKKLLSLAKKVNQNSLKYPSAFTENDIRLLTLEHHGAIRVGTPEELSMMRRLFAVMGMEPVDYYDLSVAGIPVHSTAFRALDVNDLAKSPFRVFCSLLRLDLIVDNNLRKKAQKMLDKRQVIPSQLLNMIEISEKEGFLTLEQTSIFIQYALEVFRWHDKATVEKTSYDKLKNAHGLIADVVSFKGPHINHLTPKVLDIDECQKQFALNDIDAKAIVEGPPKRNCPILLRQTSFIAIAENIVFSDGEAGSHTARFGEVEQRGVALTRKGRELYDRLLLQAKNGDSETSYIIRLQEAFENFPDDYENMRKLDLAYFYYSPRQSNITKINRFDNIDELITNDLVDVKPIVYEDFLPVSAAGIFTSNLSDNASVKTEIEKPSNKNQTENKKIFEMALGTKVEESFNLYENLQQESINETLAYFK